MNCKLTHGRLLEALAYEPLTGIFTWKICPSKNVKAGQSAGCLKSNGYVLIALDKEEFLAHRLAFFYVGGVWPKLNIDHIDGVRANNAWANLREVTHAENMQNQRQSPLGAKHSLLGVSPNKNGTGFRAFIKTRNIQRYLGTFASAQAAHAAYIAAKRIDHPRGML